MKIKHYLSGMAALAMMAACSDYDPGMSENAVDLTDAEIETIQEYTANFVERYGEMDPNHTWGFGELAEMEEMGTRAVYKNENEWMVRQQVLVYPTAEEYAADPNAQPHHEYRWTTTSYLPTNAVIPGMPSVIDNMYHAQEGVVADPNDWNTDEPHPTGDVTDEEVAYVSEWFRTNPTPESELPQFTEYFIQEISQDDDRSEYPNGAPIDKYLTVYTGGTKQQDGTWRGGTATNGQDPITFGIDYFEVQTSDGIWEHNNDLNKGNATKFNEWENPKDPRIDLSHRTIKYWHTDTEGTYTTDFRYHNSDNTQSYDNFVLVHLVFDIEDRHYDGYYLAFDYQYVKEHNFEDGKYSQRLADGYYSNWILKLSPADPEWNNNPEERTCSIKRRVMCEDLGSTFDFDFNDLVFDVEYTREEMKVGEDWEPKNPDGLWNATITLQAVGGTLPIFIKNFDGTEYDAHELMGGTLSSSGTYSPVNVGTGATHDPVTLDMVRVASTNPDNIVISVTSPDKKERGANKVTTMILPNPSGAQSFGSELAPQKICMPVNVRWTKEYQQIEWAYPRFAEWVGNENGAAGFGNDHDWTRTEVDTTKLY